MIRLKYGQEEIEFDLKNLKILAILQGMEMDCVSDVRQSIINSLNHPVNTQPFRDLFKKGERVVIVVSDVTRATGYERIYLPLMLDVLNDTGIPDNHIEIIFALGIHRKQNRIEQEGIIGEEMFRRVHCFDHDAYDSNGLTCIGNTKSGIDVLINSRVAEADRVILTGAVNLHYLAGFGGGSKAIVPGVAGFDTIRAVHLLSLRKDKPGRHPLASTGVLDGNPFREEIIDAVSLLKPTFMLNTINNSRSELSGVVSGDYILAHRRGCHILAEHYKVKVKEKADLVIASCGGFPKDINYIQAHKILEHVMEATKTGGVIILLAQCLQGIGNDTFLQWLKYSNEEVFESELRRRFEVNGQTAYATFLKTRRVHIILMSALPSEDVGQMGMIPVSTIDEALTIAHDIIRKPRPCTYIVPDGGRLLVVN